MTLRRPFYLGGLELPSNIFCAPLAGCSDLPFRQMTGSYQPGLIFCEMVKIDALIRHDPNTYRFLDYTSDMHPIGAQICGSDPQIAAAAARIIEDLGFDVIDLNCGCPVDKVVKDGSGSGLLKRPERIGEILSAIGAAVEIPITVKIRSGWNDDQINAPAITQIAEQAGAVAITVHGRTREQGYTGRADLSVIQECKCVAKDILVIGNGDVFDGPSAERMFSLTGCDGVLVARGTLGQPWVIEDIYSYLSQKTSIHRTHWDVKAALLAHFHKIEQYQCDRQALLDMRRVGCWYLKACAGAKSLRIQINHAQSLQEVAEIIEKFNWETLSLIEKPSLIEAGGSDER